MSGSMLLALLLYMLVLGTVMQGLIWICGSLTGTGGSSARQRAFRRWINRLIARQKRHPR